MDTSIEETYITQTPLAYRRKHGQYFTPPHIADVMVEWITASQPKTLLDPAVGLGIFPRAFFKRIPNLVANWTTYDTDAAFKEPLKEAGIDMLHRDFLWDDWEHRYEGIVANPPYFKLGNYDYKEEILQTFEEKLGVRLPGNTNIYNLFLLKCLEQLKDGGRAAFIVPSDFLNADYGQHVKSYLLEHKLLDYVVITDYQVSWFDDAMTTSSLLLCSREPNKEKVQFIDIQTEEEMNDLKRSLQQLSFHNEARAYTYEELDPSIKWRHYYQESIVDLYPNIRPFHKFGKATRGIATGANDFFCLTEEQRVNWNLDHTVVHPCLIKAYQASESFFTREDWEALKNANHSVYVLQVHRENKNDAVQRYIEYGEELGFHQRYLTRHRTPWYKPELRDSAPILFRVFNRSKLQFIRNEAGIKNLTSFHGLYIHECYMHDLDLFMAYFLTDIAKDIMKESRREYGNGLLKFEPNDLNHSWVVDFDSISEEEKVKIRSLYHQLRNTAPSARDGLLESLNEWFLSILKRNKSSQTK